MSTKTRGTQPTHSQGLFCSVGPMIFVIVIEGPMKFLLFVTNTLNGSKDFIVFSMEVSAPHEHEGI